MTYAYDPATGTMRPLPKPRSSWWRRLVERRSKHRRAITRAQGRQILAFVSSGDTGTERL